MRVLITVMCLSFAPFVDAAPTRPASADSSSPTQGRSAQGRLFTSNVAVARGGGEQYVRIEDLKKKSKTRFVASAKGWTIYFVGLYAKPFNGAKKPSLQLTLAGRPVPLSAYQVDVTSRDRRGLAGVLTLRAKAGLKAGARPRLAVKAGAVELAAIRVELAGRP